MLAEHCLRAHARGDAPVLAIASASDVARAGLQKCITLVAALKADLIVLGLSPQTATSLDSRSLRIVCSLHDTVSVIIIIIIMAIKA